MRLMGFKEPANGDDFRIVWDSDLTRKDPVEEEEWIDRSRIDTLEKDVKNQEEKRNAEGGNWSLFP
jgi:hypothetical protein